MNTNEILDAIKDRYSLRSDYAIHKILGVTHQQIANYRKGRSMMGDEAALKAAELLELPPEYLLACLHAERATDQELGKIWRGMADKMKKASTVTAALAFMMFFSGGPDGGAMAATRDQAETYSPNSVYYVNRLARKLWTLFRRLLEASPPPYMAHA